MQSTSIPGVAQRTGATTYYIEIWPTPWRALGGKRPVLSLVPGAGDVDIVVASELLEAARVVANGFVSKDRTAVIASTHRIYAMTERLAMGDERLDVGKLLGAIEQQAQSHLLFDMEAAAQQAGSVINAVMLGAIAASGRLPILPERFAAAIRAEGKSVEANLRGFAAGLAAVASSGGTATLTHKRRRDTRPTLEALEREATVTMPEAQAVVVEGLRRLAAYQDLGYSRLYLERLAAIRDADARAMSGGALLRETARHLALRMSFEDVIRVAQAKIDPARMKRIRDDLKLAPDEPLAVVEFFKPGIEELCSGLPPALARPIMALARRRGWFGKVHWSMDIRSTSVTGFLAPQAAGQPSSMAGAQLPVPRGAGGDRGLARPHRPGRRALGCARARDRAMRRARQGLRRHACAGRRQFRQDRGAPHPPGACRRLPTGGGGRRHCRGARRCAGRSRGRAVGKDLDRDRAGGRASRRRRVSYWAKAM